MNKEMTYEELRNRAYEIIGIPLAEIDRTGRLATGKGAVGTVVEESWFGKDPNSLAEPDFESLDIELKVTPYRVNKNNTISSKERLVSNMIDYMEEHKNESFEESSFYQKSSNLLIMFYEYLNDVNKGSFNISHVKFITLSEKMKSDNDFFFLLPKEDIEIMRQDWGIIVSKIKDGKAHEISGSDTNYLEACTKARDSSVRVDQPFSSEKAKPRAFSLKQSYMTFLLNNYVLGGNGYERLIRDVDELTATNFEDVITSRFKPYYGKTDVELANLFDISTKNKGFRNQIVSRIVGVEGNINNSQEFIKASIISKTVRVEEGGTIRESMSFPSIDYKEIVESEWEVSEFYGNVGRSRFMFSIFLNNGNDYVLTKVDFWNMPNSDLEEAKKVWDKTKNLISENKIIIGGKHGFSVTNFPKQSENRVVHVRPHDKDSKEGRISLPDGRKTIKYCFWLNRHYIKDVINQILNKD